MMYYTGPSTSSMHEGSYLERHNDSLVDELSTKVAALKKVSIFMFCVGPHNTNGLMFMLT